MTTPERPIQLGGVLATLDTVGPAARSNWTAKPLEGNDFRQRYPEDLALLAQLGVRAIRLGIDWARLQPAPGHIDDDWREWYESVFAAAAQHGVAVWAALHEVTVPAWFDDEGSFADERTTGLAWPRWVEAAAEMFGDRVAGWLPIVDPVSVAARWSTDSRKHERALVNIATAWRDSWRILQGGPPVATALGVRITRPANQTVPATEAARFEDHLRWNMWLRALRDGVVQLPNGIEHVIPDLGGALDRVGIVTSLDVPETTISDEALRRWGERLGTVLRRAADEGPDRPLMVAGLAVRWPHDEERRLFVETTVHALHAAVDDGLALQSVFVDPAVGSTLGPRGVTAASIVDRDRNTTVDTATWLALTPPPATTSGHEER